MAKEYDVIIYDDDGKGVTGAITESEIGEDSQTTYIGREWTDVEETAFIQRVLSSVAFRRQLQQLACTIQQQKVEPLMTICNCVQCQGYRNRGK